MPSIRKRRGIAAAGIGASAAVLTLVLTSLPASAAAQPGTCPEGSGAAGKSCVIHVDDVLGGAGVGAGVGAKARVGLSVQLGTGSEVAVEGSPGACTDARANRDNAAFIESGTRGRLSTANSNLNSARSTLGTAVATDNTTDAPAPDTTSDSEDLAVANAQAAVNARIGDVATAQNAENTAEASLVAAEAAVTRACNPPTTTLPPPPPPPTTTLPPPPPGNTTIVNPPPRPGNTTIVNPPPASSSGPVFVLPSPGGGNFTSPSVPSGSVATGDGSLAGTE